MGGRGWFCGGRDKMFVYRNKNKTKVGFSSVCGAFFGKNERGVEGLNGSDFVVISKCTDFCSVDLH